jgi:P4 family phage/plasmid primase-like protien
LDGVVNLTAKSKSKKTSEIDLLNNKVFVLLNLIRQCKSHQFKSSVMGECAEVFRVKDFVDKLNKNPYLIAFNNGVFDLSVFKFRPGRPEDYLSTQIYLDYEDYKTKTHPDVLEIEEFFRLVFPDPDIREYFLDCVCQLFIGINKDKLILFWTGSGNNGKSVTQTLFEKMIGIDLAIKVSTTLITNKKQSLGQASPELSRTGNGVRWIVMDEPDKEETILTGLLKQLTGNDSYWARDLYQSGSQAKQIEPMYQMHLLCNTLPKIKQPDSAFWDRVRVIPFESKFLNAEDCPSTFEEQCKLNIYPKDTDLKNKFNVMLKPLAWFLLNRLKTLKAVRLVPSKVLVATSEYKEENSHDPYLEFIEECIIYDDNLIKTAITRFDMHETFSRWFLENYSSHKLPNKKIILGEFDKLLGKGKWVGTCFKKHDNDDE